MLVKVFVIKIDHMSINRGSFQMMDLTQKELTELQAKLLEPGPYYTSYPTLGLWLKKFTSDEYKNQLLKFFKENKESTPLHLYIHIPFCAKLCWYCVCNIVVTNNREKIQFFLNYLIKEIEMLRLFFSENNLKPNITEVHFGGGTPSHLYEDQFEELMEKLSTFINFSEVEEVTMEIDPRTTTRESLRFFASKGVSRISFGVQDFDPKVQEAINRVQPPEMIKDLLTEDIRALFKGVNFDLLYGLPFQTRKSFKNTIDLVNQFSPERITLLKYAHMPELRRHMKLIKEPDLPSEENLPDMFIDAVMGLTKAGYTWVGIDNFAKQSDDLAKASKGKTVWRTFNGFTPGRTKNMIGLGPTSTAAFGGVYVQSVYELKEYYSCIDNDQFPVLRGYVMKPQDLIIREVIFGLLCNLEISYKFINEKYNIDFKEYFSNEMEVLKNFHGIIVDTNESLKVEPYGQFFLRKICRVFDRHNIGGYKISGP
jgi:oxygen-independent coproporphyrinogen-3 oxidase